MTAFEKLIAAILAATLAAGTAAQYHKTREMAKALAQSIYNEHTIIEMLERADTMTTNEITNEITGGNNDVF